MYVGTMSLLARFAFTPMPWPVLGSDQNGSRVTHMV